jgi:O-antigen/teichoic acid export membrane protein
MAVPKPERGSLPSAEGGGEDEGRERSSTGPSADVRLKGGTSHGDNGRSVRGTLLKSSGWNLAAQLTPLAINVVLTPYLIHGLGIEQYGLYALAATITIFLGSFDGGIGSTAPRFFAVYAGRDDRSSATRLLCSLGMVIVVCGGAISVGDWFVSPLLAEAFRMPTRYRPESVFLLRTFGILLTVSLLHSLFVALLQARQRFALTSKATMVSYLGWAGGLYMTVQSHYGLRGIALSLVAEQIFATAIIVPSAIKYLRLSAVGFAPRAELKKFGGFAARVQTTGIAALVNMEFDALVIGAVLPVGNVGLYNAGANVSTQTRYTVTSLLAPLANHLATVYGSDGEEAARREAVRLQHIWVIGVSGFCAVALGAVYFAVLAWLGPGFEISGLVCVILLFGHTVNLMGGVMTSYAGAIGQPGVETRYGTVLMIVNFALTVPLVFVGVLGVVGATAVGSIAGSSYLIRIVHKRLSPDIPGFFRDVPLLRSLVCLAVTAGLELVLAPALPQGPFGLILCGVPAVVGLTCFGLSVLGFRRFVLLVRAVLAGRSPLELMRT